ncbi:hypothetical protein ACFW6R_26130 [Streptomyces albidoflavus]
MPQPPSPPPPLLSLRAVVVLMTAILLGLIASGIAFLSARDVATAALYGGGVTLLAIPAVRGLVGH